MKNTSINNGKEVPKVEVDEINLLSGKYGSVKKVNVFEEGLKSCFEPKRNNRWVVNFIDAYEGIQPYAVKTVTKSKLIDGSWSNIIITLYDPIGPSTTQALMEGIRSEWQTNYREIPHIKYKLNMLDPTGVVVEEWSITGKLKEVDFGDLDYVNTEITEIKLLIEPISVILNY